MISRLLYKIDLVIPTMDITLLLGIPRVCGTVFFSCLRSAHFCTCIRLPHEAAELRLVAIRRIYHAISKIPVFLSFFESRCPHMCSARLIRNTPVCFVICKLRHLLFVSPHRITCSVPRIISCINGPSSIKPSLVVCSARQVSGSPWHFSRRQIWSPHQLHLNVLVLFLVLIPVGVGVESLPCSTQSLMGSG